MFSSQEVRVYLVALDLPPIPETRTASVTYVGLQMLSIDLRALHSVLMHVQLFTIANIIHSWLSIESLYSQSHKCKWHGLMGTWDYLLSKREYSQDSPPALHKLEGLTNPFFN